MVKFQFFRNLTIFRDFWIFKSELFCHFWFSIQKKFFLCKPTYFCLTKQIFRLAALIEHYKSISLLHFVTLRGGGKNLLFTPEKTPPPFILKPHVFQRRFYEKKNSIWRYPGWNWAKGDNSTHHQPPTTHHPPPTACFEGGKSENFSEKKLKKFTYLNAQNKSVLYFSAFLFYF